MLSRTKAITRRPFAILDIGSSKIKFLRSGSTHTIEDYLFSEFKISNTGDEYDHKICDRCFKRLETTVCFENNRHKKNNLITVKISSFNLKKLCSYL